MKGRTAVLVAHRLSMIRGVDSIGVVQDGRVVEQGSHGELVSPSILDLQHAVRGETDPARIHSLITSALSSPEYSRLHTSLPLFSLTTSRLACLHHPDLATSFSQLLCSRSNFSASRQPKRKVAILGEAGGIG
ncbi:hypothetical protein ABZP36_004014 [Zizania latifolia]